MSLLKSMGLNSRSNIMVKTKVTSVKKPLTQQKTRTNLVNSHHIRPVTESTSIVIDHTDVGVSGIFKEANSTKRLLEAKSVAEITFHKRKTTRQARNNHGNLTSNSTIKGQGTH